MDGSLGLIIMAIVLVLAVGLVIIAIVMSTREEERDERQQKLHIQQRAELRELSIECDGRSLHVTKPLGWSGADYIDLTVSARITQVFYLSTPGYEVKVYIHDPLEDSIFLKEKTVSVEALLEGPFTIKPQIGRMLTAEDVRENILPRVAAKRSYDQTDIDATVITLAEHQIIYTLTRSDELAPFFETDPVVYRPKVYNTNVKLDPTPAE